MFSGLQAGLYVLKIHAHNRKADVGVVKRGFVVTSDPTYCSLVLINRGVTISESGREVTVEVKGHGTAAGYSCVLDTELEFSCEYTITYIRTCIDIIIKPQSSSFQYIILPLSLTISCRFPSYSATVSRSVEWRKAHSNHHTTGLCRGQ